MSFNSKAVLNFFGTKKRFVIFVIIVTAAVFLLAGLLFGQAYQKYTVKKVLSKIELSESFITYFAVLAKDKSVCDKISSDGGRGLCLAAFREQGCSEYEAPNKQTCLRLKMLLDRTLEVNDVINLCDSKELQKDTEQVLCYIYYAGKMHLAALCDAICRNPIDNTNCAVESSVEAYKASCRQEASLGNR